MHYVITGHSGFIGSEVTRLLKEEQKNISLVIREGNEPKLPPVDENEEVVLLYLSGLAHRKASYSELYDANVTYLVKTIHSAFRIYNLKRLVFLSSVAVYGLHESCEIIEESFPLNADEPYGLSKIIAEQKIKEFSQQYNIDFVILRPPLVYGMNSPGNLRKLKEWGNRLHLLPLGCANSERSVISIFDLYRAIIVTANHPFILKLTFNVCENKGISTRRLMASLKLKNYFSFPIPKIIMRWILVLLGKKKMYQQLYGQRLFSNKLITETTDWRPKLTAVLDMEV